MYKCLYLIVTIWFFVVFTGCASKDKVQYVTNTQTVGASTTEASEIARVVDETNVLRFNQGQAPLVPGLVCSLYNNTGVAGVFPSTAVQFPSTLPSAVASWVYLGDINVADGPSSSGLPLIPSALRSLYVNDYAVRCLGTMVVTKSDYYTLSVRSDDAAMLYIANAFVTGLNTLHSPTTTTGVRFLTKGIHTFRLDYMQDTGDQSLQINVPGIYLYR